MWYIIINCKSNLGFFFLVCDLHLQPVSLLCISRFKVESLDISYISYTSVSQGAQVILLLWWISCFWFCRRFACVYYRIFRPITRALSIQKGSEIIKNEHARYTLERFPTNNARVICTKKGYRKIRYYVLNITFNWSVFVLSIPLRY